MPIMADFARLPTQRKVLAFVIAGALLGALYWQFLFKPLKADVEEAENQKAARVAMNAKLEQDKKDFAALKLKMCQLKRVIDENQSALPTEAELPAFFETLNRKVLESGVEVHRWNEQKEEPIETFIKVPVQIELTGSYMQIKRFFASLIEKKHKASPIAAPAPTDNGCASSGPVEDRERIVSIENLKLSNPTVVNHEMVLTATFTAATYRKEDAAPDANGAPPAPAVKKPAAPPPAAGSGAPLPPADTPAGAKARVEKAMDKEEQKKPNLDGTTKLKGGM